MTINECIETAMRWIDQATINGVPSGVAFTADFKDRMAYLIDGTVSLVESLFPIHKSHIVTQNPIKPVVGFFQPRSVMPTSSFMEEGGVTYTFEVSGTVSIYIDGVLKKSDSEEFVRFSGMGSRVKIVSEYPFMVRNFALYPCNFKEIPEYKPWVSYEMPADFAMLDRILFSGDGCSWVDFSNYRKDSENAFSLPMQTRGQFEFQYLHRHSTILPTAAKTKELDIDPKAVSIVPLRLAVDATTGVEEMQVLNQYLTARFTEMVNNLDMPEVGNQVRVETVFAP